MKTKSSNRLFTLLLLALMALPLLPVQTKASSVDFGREFGLFVHQQNQNLAVPAVKGGQVLDSYFLKTPLKASFDENKRFMSQREFLLSFEKLRLESEGKETKLSDRLLYPIAWLRARHNNWLPKAELNYTTMREFLYRYSVSKAHGGIAYFDGLVLDEDDINMNNYSSLSQVSTIGDEISERMVELRKLRRPTKTQKALLTSLVDYGETFDDLKNQLKALNHPLSKLENLPEDIIQKIEDNDLNEILDSITYNYSSNNANRIHNLVTGAMQITGKVFQPDEEMDFEKELGGNGWGIYKNGWVIFGGEEVWQFGGGLCGSATITFTPSWRAGLEIIRRYPHSVYYRSLYPEDSFGLDATIYRGAKNLVMKNTTGSPVLYYVVNDHENMEVTMHVIGNSPYKNIDIEGPIFTGRNTYKWIRRMEQFDGTVVEDELVTRYGLIH